MSLRVVNSLLENAFAVVECLAAEAKAMRLSDIADRLGLQKSGTHRIVSALVQLGWLEQDAETTHYRLTFRLAALGQSFLASTRILDVCQPVLDRVAQESKELVRLAVVDSEGLTTVAHAQGAQGSLICQSRVFPQLPLHVTASGKAWLASLTNEAALKLVLAAGFGAPADYGPNAVRSASELLSDLKATRERGYGLAREEAEPGLSAISVLVQPEGVSVKGTLAIVAPAVRMNETRQADLAVIAHAAARELAMLWPLRNLSWSDIPHPQAVA
jgi:IclR family acetate operon transcriptional repressor